MSKIRITWTNKVIYLLTAGLTSSLFMDEANSMDLAIKRRLAALAQSNPVVAKQFVDERGGVGAELLFPKHWDSFFKHCDPLGYMETVNTMCALAQGTLGQPFVAEVKADMGAFGHNIVVGGANLSAWIDAAQGELFRSKLKGFPEYHRNFNRYKAAVKVHEALNGLDTPSCQAIFNLIIASQDCTKSIKEAYAQHIGNLNYNHTSITNAVVNRVIDGRQPRDQAERDAKIDIERQFFTNLGIPQNHAQAVAHNIVVNNAIPVTALITQLRLANAILIGGQDITANVVQKVLYNNVNFAQATQAAARVNAALSGVDDGACEPVFNLVAASLNCAKSVKEAYAQHIGNLNYKNTSITNAVVNKVIEGRLSRVIAERDAKIDMERQLLLNLGVPQNHAQAAAHAIVVNGTNPVNALVNHLTPVLVEGQDVTLNVAQRIIQGDPLIQATREARTLKYFQILEAKAYGFTNETCQILACELEKGSTLEQACRDKLPVIHCAGKEIQALVIQKMIVDQSAFGVALEQVSIQTHLQNLRDLNARNHLGLIDADLQQVAQRVARKQNLTYQAALSEVLAPNMFGFEGVQTNISPQVAALVFIVDVPGISLASAQETIKIGHVKAKYQQKNLSLSIQELDMISRAIVVENKSVLESFKACLALAPQSHRGQLLTDRLANALVANQPKATALAAIKLEMDQAWFAGLNIGLTPQQALQAATFAGQGFGDLQALAKVLPVTRCMGEDITLAVAERMITEKETYVVATKNRKIDHYFTILVQKTVDLDHPSIRLMAIQLTNNENLSLADVLKTNLPVVSYEGVDLRLKIAEEMLKKMSYQVASEKVWIATAVEDISITHSKIKDLAPVLAKRMFDAKQTKNQALQDHLKTLPFFSRTQAKSLEISNLILAKNISIDAAWYHVCVQPKVEELNIKYPNIAHDFGEEGVTIMAVNSARTGDTDEALLNSLLKELRVEGKYCTTAVIANFMITDKISCTEAMKKADTQGLYKLVRKDGAWRCLKATQVEALVELILSSQLSIEEGEENFLLSLCPNLPGNYIIEFVKFSKFSQKSLKELENECLATLVIPQRLQRENPNLNNGDVIRLIATKLVKDERYGDTVDVATLKAALQEHYKFDAGIPVQAIAQMAEKMAVKLLENRRLYLDEALLEVRIDDRAKTLKAGELSHLSDPECLEVSTIMIRNRIDRVAEALRSIFQARKYTDGQEIDQIVNAILVQRKSFEQAEELFGFRKLMVDDPRLNDAQARQISLWMRQDHLSLANAYKKFMRDRFDLLDTRAVDSCFDFYFSNNEGMEVAAEKATYAATTAATLRGMRFYPHELNDDNIWNISLMALGQQRDLTKGMAQYLLQEYGAAPHLTREANELLRADYYTWMASAILPPNNITIGECTATDMGRFDEFEASLLNCFAMYIDINTRNLRDDQKVQYWSRVFGEANMSLPTVAAIMMYKFGINPNRILENHANFEPLKADLMRAVPIFLQHIKPNDAKVNLYCLGQGNDRDCLVEAESVAPLCAGFYTEVAGKMIQGKQLYAPALQQLKLVVSGKIRAVCAEIPYLRVANLPVANDSYVLEIAEADIFAKMDRKAKAIYRFLNNHLSANIERRPLSTHLTVLRKNPANLEVDERNALFANCSDVFSFNTNGRSFEVVCQEYRQKFETQLQKLQAKIAGKIPCLTVDDCEKLIWEVQILKERDIDSHIALQRTLTQILRAKDFKIPALLLDREMGSAAQKRAGAMTKLAGVLKLDLSFDNPPLSLAQAMESLVRAQIKSTLNLQMKLPISDIDALSLMLAREVLRPEVCDLPTGRLKQIQKEKTLEALTDLLREKYLSGADRPLSPVVAQIMLESQSPVLCALVEAKGDNLCKTTDKQGLDEAMFAFWGKLAALKECAIIQDDITVTPQLVETLKTALAFKERIREIKDEGVEGTFDELTDLQIVLASYHHAKRSPQGFQEVMFLEGQQPLQESICMRNLQLLNLQDAHFSCRGFNLRHDLVKVARSLRQCEDVLKYDPQTIGILYRRANNIIPMFVEDSEQQRVRLCTTTKAALKKEWEAYLVAKANEKHFNYFNQDRSEKYPTHPKFLTAITDATKAFGRLVGGPLKINMETLQFDPWFVATAFDRLPEVSDQEYDGFRNDIFTRVRRHCVANGFQEMNRGGRCSLIGRFFAWGKTSDFRIYIFGQEHFNGAELSLWRKRVKQVCEKYIFANAPTDEQVFDKVACLYDPTIENCNNASKDALLMLEQNLPPAQRLTIFNKVAGCLNTWKVAKLDSQITKVQAGGVETEYARFMRLACQKTLSVNTLEMQMTHFDQCDVRVDGNAVAYGNRVLQIRPFIIEYLTAYQQEMFETVKQSICYKVKPENDGTNTIYFQDILDWAKFHPKYCNVLETEILNDLTVNGAGKEVKDVVVHRLLSHAGYIDWEDRDQ